MESGGTDLILPAMSELLPGLLFALLWAAVPIFVSASLARSRGLHAGPAIALGLFTGWLGMAIVLAFYRPSVDRTIDPNP